MPRAAVAREIAKSINQRAESTEACASPLWRRACSPRGTRAQMPSVYNHLHSIVSGGLVKALDLMPHSGDVEEGGVRSLCGGTLDAKISELDRATASFDIQMLEGRGDISKAFFKRDRSDVGKLKALKAVAIRLKENGCMTFSEAAKMLRQCRSVFLGDLVANRTVSGVSVPIWSEKCAGNELLSRLPVVRDRISNPCST